MGLQLVKDNESGQTYQGDDFKVLYRNKGSVSGDNNANVNERIYLMTGEVSLTVKEDTKIIVAPAEFNIPESTYHKIEAITDFVAVVF